MKLVLLHGPAIKSSREKLINLKNKFDTNSVMVFEQGSNTEEILGSLATIPLLFFERLIILENPPEDLSPNRVADETTLIVWFDHEVLDKKPVMEYAKKNGQILFFPESKEISVFPFLDYLTSGDKRAFLEIDKLKKANFEIQYFIIMIFYMLRSLILTPKNAPSFVKDKLNRQKERFSLEDIKKLYRQILEIDFKLKSGLIDSKQAEFSLVNLFCY